MHIEELDDRLARVSARRVPTRRAVPVARLTHSEVILPHIESVSETGAPR